MTVNEIDELLVHDQFQLPICPTDAIVNYTPCVHSFHILFDPQSHCYQELRSDTIDYHIRATASDIENYAVRDDRGTKGSL